MHLSGTKQEWGRIYGFLELLLQEGTEMGNHRLLPRENRRLTLIQLERVVEGGTVSIQKKADGWDFCIDTEFEKKEVFYSKDQLTAYKTQLWESLQGSEGSFIQVELETFLENISIYDFRSTSETGEDFTALFSRADGIQTFSTPIRIHSLIDRHYLMASNRASNFKFEINQVKFSNPEANKINALGDDETGSLTRLNEIFRLGGRLKYSTVEGKFFLSALQLIDMHLPKLVSEMVRLFYTSDHITLKDLTQELNQINLFKVKDEVIEKSRIYEYKIKQLLFAAVCGLKPSKSWRGYGQQHLHIYTTGKDTLLAYDPSEKELFERFLWENTRLSLANETKSKYGFIEKENGQWLIKLNLEICFK